MTEIRYWPRIGMRVEKKAAEEFIEKIMSDGSKGSVLDDDLEEFVNVVPLTAAELHDEINTLFESPPDLESPAYDDFNQAILDLMEFESNRKKYILGKKDEGMTLQEAKDDYEAVKAALVREHLELPEPEESEDENTEEEEE